MSNLIQRIITGLIYGITSIACLSLSPVSFVVFFLVAKYAAKYNKMPTQEAFKIEIESNNRFSDDQYIAACEIMPTIFDTATEKSDTDWILDTTEKWCQDRAIHNACQSLQTNNSQLFSVWPRSLRSAWL